MPKKRSRRAAPQLDEPRDSLDVESLMADLCAVKQEVKEELLDEILTPGERAATIFAGKVPVILKKARFCRFLKFMA